MISTEPANWCGFVLRNGDYAMFLAYIREIPRNSGALIDIVYFRIITLGNRFGFQSGCRQREIGLDNFGNADAFIRVVPATDPVAHTQ